MANYGASQLNSVFGVHEAGMNANNVPPAGEVIHGRRRVRRILIALPFVLLAVGFGIDACSGLPVSRAARSPYAWLGGVLGLGALYLVGEGAAEWVSGPDKVTDPLWMRTLRLIALLGLWGLFLVGVHYLIAVVG
jgi:hypothetical protein